MPVLDDLEHPADTWQVRVFDPRTDAAALASLRERGQIWQIHDTLAVQLHDLMETRRPALRALPVADRVAPLREAVATHLGDTPLSAYGRWVYYPWSGQLVHLLPPDEHRELRLDRNRNKLSTEEMARLRGLTVGVVGLSVGNAVALTLALEGACGRLKLADFDVLDLSNMNRLRAGVHEIGLPKTVLAARQIAEFDPYFPVTLFGAGLAEDTIDPFLGGAHPVDVLIDECDGIGVKFLVRERARARGIPVIMETSDRGMIDVERFDLEPERPLFHGLVGDVDARALLHLGTEEKVRHVMDILGVDGMSTRFGATLFEVERTVATWPQLASDVMLGGASVAQAVRRLALGQPLPSGRRYIDLDAALDRLEPAPARTPGPPSDPERTPLAALDPDLRALLAEAAQAPSGGNVQPWRLHVDGLSVWIGLHPVRGAASLLDVGRVASHAALGAVAETLCIGAAARGYGVQLDPFPGPADIDARVHLTPGPPSAALAALHPLLARRVTNRRATPSAPLTAVETTALHAAAHRHEAQLAFLTDPAALGTLGEVIGQGDRLRALNDGLNRELMTELSFAHADAAPDTISLDTCELTGLERAAFRLLGRPDVVARVRALDGGDRLADISRKALATSSAAVILHVADDTPAAAFAAGRAMLHVWLAATGLDLAFQPVGTLPYMVRMLSAPAGAAFDATDRARLAALDAQLHSLFPATAGRARMLLFRLHRSPPPSARSGRLPLSEVVVVGRPPGG